MNHNMTKLLIVAAGWGCILAGTAGAGEGDGRHAQGLVTNAVHRETCGACHMAYPPALLPAASWEKIVAALPSHNGENVELANATRKALLEFLKANAADTSPRGLSRRILKSLAGATPTRITQVPAIQAQHRGLGDDVFNRKEIGSRANCRACHPGAESARFSDDDVRIPGGRPASQGGREGDD